MNLKTLLRGCATVALLAGSAVTSQAAYILYDLSASGQITDSTSGVGNYIEYTHASGFVVTATAYTNEGPGGALTAARLDRWSGGLGVCGAADVASGNCGSPNHSTDNNLGKDFVLFRFSGFADPYRLNLGWTYSDADVQYWVGSESNPTLQGLLIADLATEGFPSSNVDEGSSTRWFDLLGGSGYSLLVSGQLDEYNDYFKIKKLKLDPSEVPEPATYGLVGVALLGLATVRRKRS